MRANVGNSAAHKLECGRLPLLLSIRARERFLAWESLRGARKPPRDGLK